MLRLGAQAWELIKIPYFTPRAFPIISQIDSENIAILGGYSSDAYWFSNGVLLNAETCAVVRVINPTSEIKFNCEGQSFMKTPGEIVSLVTTSKHEVCMI